MSAQQEPCLSFMKDADCERIHQASVELLHTMGVQIINDDATRIFRRAGFEIVEECTVKFAPDQVEAALKTVPSKFVRKGLSPGFDVELGGDTLAMGAGSVPLYVLEAPSYERRDATLDDLLKFTRLVDGLENFAIGNGVVLPRDVPASVLHAVWNLNAAVNTVKPSCCYYATSRQMGEDGIAVMAAAAGGEDDLRESKTWAVSVCQEKAMTFGPSLYGVTEMAPYEIPIEVIPMPISGSMHPVTMAGTLAQVNAEALSVIVLAQLVHPGCPIIYAPSYGGAMDMATGAHCFGAPEAALQGAALAQLGRWYGLPTNMMAGISDSKTLDEQAAWEKMMVILLPALAGAHCITQAGGLLDFALSGSYEQMVIDNEICGQILHLVNGFEINDETLALDVIRQVGFGGTYIAHEHTVQHFRQALWLARLADRDQYAVWAEKGRKDVVTRAKEKAEEIIANHRPMPLASNLAQAAAEAARAIFSREDVDYCIIEKTMAGPGN